MGYCSVIPLDQVKYSFTSTPRIFYIDDDSLDQTQCCVYNSFFYFEIASLNNLK